MKTWLMPQVKVDVFSPNEFVAACVKFTADGPCGQGIDIPQGVMTKYDILVPEQCDTNHDGVLTFDEAVPAPKTLVYDQCGQHAAGDTAVLQYGWIVDNSGLSSPDKFWYKPVYYWQSGGNGPVHAIGVAEVGQGGSNYVITNHS